MRSRVTGCLLSTQQVLQLHKRLILFKKARVTGQASSYEQPWTPAETTEILSGVSGCKYMTIFFFNELKFCSKTLTFLFHFKWTARHVFPRDIRTSSNKFSRTARPPTALNQRQSLLWKMALFCFSPHYRHRYFHLSFYWESWEKQNFYNTTELWYKL